MQMSYSIKSSNTTLQAFIKDSMWLGPFWHKISVKFNSIVMIINDLVA